MKYFLIVNKILSFFFVHLDVALEGEKRPLKLVSFQFKVPSQLDGTTKKVRMIEKYY